MITQKQAIRAAVKIFDGLQDEGLEPISSYSIESEYESLLNHCKNHRIAIERGWYVAAQDLQSKIEHCASYLEQSVSRLRISAQQKPKPQLAGMRDIYLDLLHLIDEFDDVEIGKAEISVVTGPIEFDGVYLGRFRISVSIDYLDYAISALDPNPSHDGYLHPHLSGSQLCEGEGSSTISAAKTDSRILDLFTVLRSIIETYNPDSPYCAIEDWNCNPCASCGGHYDSENEGCYCENCEAGHCDECSTYCVGCSRSICHNCAGSSCEYCGCSLCDSDCGESCVECGRLICGHCNESYYDGLCGDCEERRIENEVTEETETITTI